VKSIYTHTPNTYTVIVYNTYQLHTSIGLYVSNLTRPYAYCLAAVQSDKSTMSVVKIWQSRDRGLKLTRNVFEAPVCSSASRLWIILLLITIKQEHD